MSKFSVDIGVRSRRQTLENHDGRNEEKLFADVEHEFGSSGSHEVNHILDRRHVSLTTVDLKEQIIPFC